MDQANVDRQCSNSDVSSGAFAGSSPSFGRYCIAVVALPLLRCVWVLAAWFNLQGIAYHAGQEQPEPMHGLKLVIKEEAFSFESGMHRKSALQLPMMMMMLGKEQLSGL